jgi:uncharacterized protein (TIGR00255 family)
MKSMTGYGFSEYKDETMHLSVEIKSYNNRYLDLFINLPQHASRLEPKMRDLLSQKIERGRVELYCKMREFEEDPQVYLDYTTAKRYAAVLKELQQVTGVRGRPRLSHLIRMEGVLKSDNVVDIEALWRTLHPLTSRSLEAFEQTRKQEGEKTKKDIAMQIEILQQSVAAIESHSEELEEKIKSNLMERFTQLLGEGVDENRVYAETAVLLVKYSISEELQRLRAHIESFTALLGSEAPAGKKLDFICQELNREINTIGSKSVILDVNQAVISSKDAIEKMREQLRNVE